MSDKYRKGQLRANGKLGTPESFNFIPASVIAERLRHDGSDMMLTIGLRFRNPRTQDKVMPMEDAVAWLTDGRNAGFYTFEAYYTGDGYLHVDALTSNDLF